MIGVDVGRIHFGFCHCVDYLAIHFIGIQRLWCIGIWVEEHRIIRAWIPTKLLPKSFLLLLKCAC